MLKFKIYLLAAITLFSVTLSAQSNTNSPYSRFGLGELNRQGLVQNLSMGGAAIGIHSGSQINYINPAAYTAIDTMSFLFDFGVSGSQTRYETNSLNTTGTNFNIHHIAMGFGISKNWKASVGIVPYSSVGYNITESKYLSGAGLLDYYYKGSGGLNKFYMGTAVKFFNHVSIGANLSYIFGYLNYANTVVFPSGLYGASTVFENRLSIADMTYNLGIQYHETIGEKMFFTVGAVFDNETNLKTSRALVQTTTYPGTKTSVGDSVIIDPSFVVNSEKHSAQTVYPMNMGLGFSFGIKNKLMIAGDYSSQEWSKAIIPGKSDSLVNSSSINLGVEFIPNDQAIQGYLNHIRLRAGFYSSKSYLSFRGEQINDNGISFGFGLPFKGTRSSFNLGFTAGQRGTLNSNLIRETYGIVNFGLTLHDFWFYKTKFD
jgi:hypothetical protein